MEATFSLGLISFGLLTLVPLLVMGEKTARLSRTEQDTAQIAQTLAEEARQGTLVTGTTYLDFQGNTCAAAQAAYTAQAALVPFSGNTSLTQLMLRVTPLGAPDHVRTYAVIFAPAS